MGNTLPSPQSRPYVSPQTGFLNDRYGNDPNAQSCATKHKGFGCCHCCTRWSLGPSKHTMLGVHSSRSQRDFWVPNTHTHRHHCSNPHFQGSLSLRTGSTLGLGEGSHPLSKDPSRVSLLLTLLCCFPPPAPSLQVVPGTLHCRNVQRTDGPFRSGRSSHNFSPALRGLFLLQL